MNTALIFACLVAYVVAGHHASYEFKYGVTDHHTGDIKSQSEHRHGKEVSGIYTLKEADGTTRIVKYHAGPHSGFNAVVERVGHAQHPAHYGHAEAQGHSGGGAAAAEEGGSEVESLGGHHEGGSSYVGTTHFGYKQ